MAQARYIFDVLNLSLKEELTCGPFLLQPISEGQDELRSRTSMDTEPVISAFGILPIPEDIGREEWWSFIHDQPLRDMELLLSFAERRYVEAHNPFVQEKIGGKWEFGGWHQHLSHLGNPHGVSWYMRHSELQEYMDRCLPILTDRERGKESGLRLALEMYRSNFQDDFVELQYLKTWMAFEILYSSGTAEEIVGKNRFRHIRRAIRSTLDRLQAEEHISEEEQSSMNLKLPELNRKATFDRAMAFLARVFADYPAQDVTDEEMRSFIDIRNSITHRIVPSLPDTGKIEDPLHVEHMRLKSLLERVILAMLGQEANLMNFSWRNRFDAR